MNTIFCARMHASLCLLVLALQAVHAAPDPVPLGERSCRFFVDEASPVSKGSWTGPCKDGFADGQGVLVWEENEHAKSRYEGGMLRGHRHGLAYVVDERGNQFEGQYVNGKREGNGVLLLTSGNEYDGQWKDGMRHGQGTASYGTGGRYAGQWAQDKFHGRGTATYIGGSTFEGEFVNGRPAPRAVAQPVADETAYVLKDTRHTLSRRELSRVKGIPFDASYQDLTAAQKQTARQGYPMLLEEDEPPFPANGMQSAAAWMSRLQDHGRLEGHLILHVTVGSDGKASAVNVLKSPSPKLTTAATLIMMEEKFKPGICAGQPCPMTYPIEYLFYLE